MNRMRENHEHGGARGRRRERPERDPEAPPDAEGGTGERAGRGGPDKRRGRGRPEDRRGRGRTASGGRDRRRGGWRAGRGDVRAAILALLSERPMRGYEMIRELEKRTDGVWRLSPGALYPALQLLEEEGLVVADDSSGKRLLDLTDAGRQALADDGSVRPWEHVAASIPPAQKTMSDAVDLIGTAAGQVAQVGTEDQQARATEILTDTRKALYKLLAEDE